MNNNKVKNRNLISRFSSSLLGRGKKAEGHKTFFNLLLFLKVNAERELLNLDLQQNKLKTSTSFVSFLSSIGFHEKAFQSMVKLNSQSFPSCSGSYTFQKHPRSLSPLKCLSQDRSISEKERQYVLDENDFLISSPQAFPNKLLCKISIDNVKPILETRKIRKGRMTYRIPLVTRIERQEGKAISWLIAGASSRKNKVKSGQIVSTLPVNVNVNAKGKFKSEKEMSLNIKTVDWHSTIVEDKKKHYRSLKYCLAESILDAFQGKGESVEKRKEYHQLALQNRAYTHYRWW